MSFIQQALNALDNGEVESMKKLVQQALKQDSDDDLFDGAQELAVLGISDQAAVIYFHLLNKYPDEDILKVNLAEIMISDDQIEQATDLLSQIDPESDAYLPSLLVSADLYQTLGIYEVSDQKLQTALKLAPQEPVIQFALAELYFNENKFTVAIVFYERLLEAKIEDFSGISIRQRLAAAYAGNGQYEEAVKQYQQTAIELMNADNLYNYASLELELKNYKQAHKITKQLLELSPDYSAAYILAAKEAEHDDDYGKVLQNAQTGLGYDQFNQVLYSLGAKAAVKLDDVSTARDLLLTGIDILDAPASLVIQLSDLYLQEDKYQDSLDLLNKYQEELTDEPKVHWNKARSLRGLEDFSAALEEMLLIFTDFTNDADYLKDLIGILQENAQTDLLPVALKQYLQVVPDDWEMNELLQELMDQDEN